MKHKSAFAPLSIVYHLLSLYKIMLILIHCASLNFFSKFLWSIIYYIKKKFSFIGLLVLEVDRVRALVIVDVRTAVNGIVDDHRREIADERVDPDRDLEIAIAAIMAIIFQSIGIMI